MLGLLLPALLAASAAFAQDEPTAQPPASSSAEPASQTSPAEPADATQVGTVPVATASEPSPEPAPKNATMLDTIEVTASKRVKSQRDLPGSVGALRGEELEKMKAQGLSDYLKLLPGVSLIDLGSGESIPVIRGIASSIDGLGTQFTGTATGIFLDDMPFNDLFLPTSIPDLNPFDLERVEVLKGPQGTLFGSSALAGAVRYVVQKPDLSVWRAKVSETYSTTHYSESPSFTHAASLNAPIGDTAAVRVVGLYRDDAGLYDSRPNGSNTRDENDIDGFTQKTGRVLGRWEVTPELKVSGLYFLQDTDQPDSVGASNNSEVPERNDIPFQSPFKHDFSGANLTASYDFDVGNVLYSGNLLHKHANRISDYSTQFPDQFGNQQDADWYALLNATVKGYTHELRFSSPEGGVGDWEWLGGLAYLSYFQDMFNYSPNPGTHDGMYYSPKPEHPDDVAEQDRVNSFLWATIVGDGTEQSAFGEATRKLGPRWEATLGARLYRTQVIADTVLTGAQIVALSNPPGQTYSRNRFVSDERGVNPKFALRYLHDENMQVYLLAARGFQFGGFQLNPPLANTQDAAEAQGFHYGPYKSSMLWNYESGLRTEWLDRRLRFDLAAFYLDWKDLQLTVQVPLNPAPVPAPVVGLGVPRDVTLDLIVNVAAAHSEGIEASFEVLPFDGAKFTSSAAWISALTDVPFDENNEQGPVPAGTRLPGSPRFQWANVFAYENALPYFSSWTGTFALTHSHIGNSPNSLRPTGSVGGYDTLDTRFDLLRAGWAWMPEVSLGLNNITDVRGVAVSGGGTDGVTATDFRFVRPRTVLLSLAWKY